MKAFRIAAAAALIMAASQANASLVKTSVFGGYTTFGMDDVNKAIQAAKAAGETATEISDGFFVGGDVLFTAGPLLKIGPRVEYIVANTGSVSGPGGSLEYSNTLLPLMGGVTVGTDFPGTGFGFEVGAFAGYGIASMEVSNAALSLSASEGGFVAELSAKLSYSLAPLVTFDIITGYRSAKITIGAGDADYSGLIAGGGFGISF